MLLRKRERRIKRILIVEDEPLIAFDNEHFLTDAGYEIAATVDRVDDALLQVARDGIDLVLADVNLSDGTSLAVAEAARDRGTPLLFVTGHCPPEAQGLSVGCLTKPYNQKSLLAAIEAVDARLAGQSVRRTPPGLTLFG